MEGAKARRGTARPIRLLFRQAAFSLADAPQLEPAHTCRAPRFGTRPKPRPDTVRARKRHTESPRNSADARRTAPSPGFGDGSSRNRHAVATSPNDVQDERGAP